MGGTQYAVAVGAVKAMENFLLTQSDMEQLINAVSKAEFDTLLSAKSAENKTLSDVWEMLKSYVADSRELEILLYRNDFHNLKAVIKAMFSDRSPENYFINPSNVSLATLDEALHSKNTDILPDYMRETAVQAYELLTKTLDGQLVDSLIDSSALMAMQKSAERYGGDFMRKYVDLITVCADIKTAYRCGKMGKNRTFLEVAVCGSSEIDKESLIRASLSGTDGLLAFLEKTQYSEMAQLLKESSAKFEKYCDDIITELAESTRMQAFGIEPLIAYYIAKEAEIKNLRIISVCQESGADRETITERLRKLYV